jgi:hypothetical protein
MVSFRIRSPTLFQIASSRSRSVLEELVGTEFQGFIHFDYFLANCSFAWNYSMKAQYCWAHLIRDMTQGTRSERGQRYHEPMWTAIATCGKQNRSFFHFLHESIDAKIKGLSAPSLMTDQS